MFRKSNVDKTVKFFLVSLKYREIVTVKIVTLHKKQKDLFSLKVFKTRKKKVAKKRRWH